MCGVVLILRKTAACITKLIRNLYIQTPSSRVFYKKRVLKTFSKPESLFLIKLQASGYKRLQHRCFPVNFAKFLKTLVIQNTSGGCFCIFGQLPRNKNKNNRNNQAPPALKRFSTNPTKWANTLKQFVGKLATNCLSVFDHSVGLALKQLSQARNQEFFRAGEVSENKGTSINI